MKTFFTFISITIILLVLSLQPRKSNPENLIQTMSDITGNAYLTGNVKIAEGTIGPGNSPGIITIDGNFNMTSLATFEAELKDLTGAGTGHDQVSVSGNVDLDGTLDILLDGYTPNDVDQFEIIAYNGTLSGTFSSINWPASMSTWAIDYGVLNPGKVTLYGPDSPLPVELLSFNVYQEDGQNMISWQTASEIGNDYFLIEHSRDANVFTSLDRVVSKGMGNSMIKYTYTHEHPTKGINYYRLRQVDYDGRYEYSHILSILNGNDEDIVFYPNPSSDEIYFNQPVESVSIYNLLGKEVLTVQNVKGNLNISQLNPGNYILSIKGYEVRKRLYVN